MCIAAPHEDATATTPVRTPSSKSHSPKIFLQSRFHANRFPRTWNILKRKHFYKTHNGAAKSSCAKPVPPHHLQPSSQGCGTYTKKRKVCGRCRYARPVLGTKHTHTHVGRDKHALMKAAKGEGGGRSRGDALPPPHHKMVALKLQRFQYSLKKVFL